MIDFTALIEYFLTPQTGVILFVVMFIMETLIKPLAYKYLNGTRKKPFIKHTVMPLLVCGLSAVLALGIAPAAVIGSITSTLLYGFSVGVIGNFLYRAGGLSYLSKKLGIEEKVSKSIYPPPEE